MQKFTVKIEASDIVRNPVIHDMLKNPKRGERIHANKRKKQEKAKRSWKKFDDYEE